MKIRVQTTNKAKKEKVQEATTFFLSRLLEPDDRVDLDVQIIFVDIEDMKDTVDLGWCGPMDNKKYPTSFEIALKRYSREKELISTLAHECVHVKQYAKAELRVGDTIGNWKGKRYVMSNVAWEKRPWEIEADKWENILYTEYKEIFS